MNASKAPAPAQRKTFEDVVREVDRAYQLMEYGAWCLLWDNLLRRLDMSSPADRARFKRAERSYLDSEVKARAAAAGVAIPKGALEL